MTIPILNNPKALPLNDTEGLGIHPPTVSHSFGEHDRDGLHLEFHHDP